MAELKINNERKPFKKDKMIKLNRLAKPDIELN